jgi:hypothetical protein
MKVEYRTEVRSTPDRLWDILTDVKVWPEWQDTSCVEPPPGPLHKGSSFGAELGGLKWTLHITEADKPRKLVWTGRRRGLKGVHEWELARMGEKTEVVSRETLSGWMLPLVYIAKKRVTEGVQAQLAGLKSSAESTLS